MADSLILYTNPRSRGRIVRWMLEETGAAYEAKIVQYGPEMKSKEYLAMNPMGKVPVLKHGNAIITEAAACCAYLADAFPAAKLTPDSSDHAACANYVRWMFFCAGPLEAAITNKSLGVNVPEDKKGFIGYGSYEDVIRTLLTAVDGKEFVAGKHFTAADVYVASHLDFGMMFDSIDKHPTFEAYVKRMKARPAAIRAAQLDDALAAAAA